MELKNEQVREPAEKQDALLKKPKAKERRARDFIEDIKAEFKNITWTSTDELRVYTKIVIGATFVLGLSVYLVDLVIQMVLSSLTWITRITVG